MMHSLPSQQCVVVIATVHLTSVAAVAVATVDSMLAADRRGKPDTNVQKDLKARDLQKLTEGH